MITHHWGANKIDNLLNLWVGEQYGKSPVDNIELIRESKSHEANNIVNLLSLNKQHTVIDLGSGGGFIANSIAPKVKTLYCLDISKDFLEYCRRETSQQKNVECYLINYANLNSVIEQPVDAIYSVAVFIHFNLYDVFHYLKACFDCLKPGGKLLFDFYNIEKLNIHDKTFIKHTSQYLAAPGNLASYVYYNHPATLHQIYSQIGFKLVETKEEDKHVFLVLEK
jgi:cyclopropane fatty-acyl-phospholipid synthase-like methyltransferase